MSRQIKDMGECDVAVIGGGTAVRGCGAARLGGETVLIQNRPVLGGNASIEVSCRRSASARGEQDPLDQGKRYR